jgi:ferredoxin
MKISVDVDKCIGSGGCVIACPEVFDLDDDGIVVLLDANPPDALTSKVEAAIDACPAAVIAAAPSN